MKYNVLLDSRGYVLNLVHTCSSRDFCELNLEDYDLDKLHAYRLGYNKLIFDSEEWKRIESEEQKKSDLAEISELKAKLTETDYIFAHYCEELLGLDNALTWVADVIKLNLKYMKEYKEVIANRKEWRERIEELESHIRNIN